MSPWRSFSQGSWCMQLEGCAAEALSCLRPSVGLTYTATAVAVHLKCTSEIATQESAGKVKGLAAGVLLPPHMPTRTHAPGACPR
jgi:hypothetical protein